MALALLMLCGTAMADNFSFLPSRTENGKEYLAHPSSELTTILLIGYDHYANGQIEEEPSQYHLGGQSDFLLLLVIDHKNQQIHQLQFDRDTMTPIQACCDQRQGRGDTPPAAVPGARLRQDARGEQSKHHLGSGKAAGHREGG